MSRSKLNPNKARAGDFAFVGDRKYVCIGQQDGARLFKNALDASDYHVYVAHVAGGFTRHVDEGQAKLCATLRSAQEFLAASNNSRQAH